MLLKIFLIYLAVISLVSIIVCVYDKKISKKNRVELRIPEKTLLLLSLFGGSIAMFVTMQLIRHKTKHVIGKQRQQKHRRQNNIILPF